MGDTVWVLPEGKEEDDWDHSLTLREEKGLNKLSEALGVKKISDLLDYSIQAEEFGQELQPNYVEPNELESTLSSLVTALKEHHPAYKPKRADELLEELEDMLAKVRKAAEDGVRVRLSVIM
jgi:hypothetical protein